MEIDIIAQHGDMTPLLSQKFIENLLHKFSSLFYDNQGKLSSPSHLDIYDIINILF